MQRCWFGFLLGGILVQGSLGQAGETAQAKIKRALFSICMERMVGPNEFEPSTSSVSKMKSIT